MMTASGVGPTTRSSGYGRAIDQDGVLIWSGSGRPLSEYELRLRPNRSDVWLRAFDDVYRLRLTFAFICQIEREYPLGILLGGIPADDHTPACANVPHVAYRRLIEAGLVGGLAGIVRGEQVTVDPATADVLVAQLDTQPVSETWRIARPLLQAELLGRPGTPEEVDAFTIGGGDHFIVPTWAWEQAA